MIKVSLILHSCSLLILDEVGWGTSTYNGVSLAWELIEYIIFRTYLEIEDRQDGLALK